MYFDHVTSDFDLAEKVSSGIKVDSAEVAAVSVDDLLSEIPNPFELSKPLRFEMNEEMEMERKRVANRRRRERNAAKLRLKYKEHPELHREAVNWKNEEKKEEKTKEIRERKKETKSSQKKKGKQKKKKKKYEGAQGGTTGGEGLQVHDIGDPRNRKKDKSGKMVVPDHIKKRKRRK